MCSDIDNPVKLHIHTVGSILWKLSLRLCFNTSWRLTEIWKQTKKQYLHYYKMKQYKQHLLWTSEVYNLKLKRWYKYFLNS